MVESGPPVRTLDLPIPKPVFRHLINPLMKGILRSPFHTVLSDSLLLITFTGRRSGATFTTPVGYEERNGTLYLTSRTDRGWWKNLRHHPSVTVRVRGETRTGIADIIENDAAVAGYILEYIDRHGMDRVNRLGIAIDSDGVPEKETLALGLTDTVVIRIDLEM